MVTLTSSPKYFAMPEGTVKFLNESEGFGFITPADGSNTIFVHSSGLRAKVREGDNVSYEIKDTPNGPSAVKVKRFKR